MSSQKAISINEVSKSFKIYKDRPHTLKEKLLRLRSNEYVKFQALKNVSIDINTGETVGIIGHNGCGKSTLLKLITNILRPDSGEITVKGRVSSLIELGAGFHPDFTGRENIYINASIFGLTRKEVDKKLEEIIRFSELEEFIDNPVRTYSSGMYMKLAFSVAISVDPEILLIDEILSVGDANFQRKCYSKIEGFKNSGATILIVAHDLNTIVKLCDKVIWLNGGEIVAQGRADKIVDLYNQHMNELYVLQRHEEYSHDVTSDPEESDTDDNSMVLAQQNVQELLDDNIRWGSKEVEIVDARIINHNGETTNILSANKSFSIEIDYQVHQPQEEYIFGVGIYTSHQELVFGNNTQLDNLKVLTLDNKGTVRVDITSCNLLTGTYKLNVAVVDGHHRALDFIKYYMDFSVISNDKSTGIVSIEHKWKLITDAGND